MNSKPAEFSTKVMTSFALMLASFFVLGCFLVSKNIQNIVQSWSQHFQLSIYFDESASNQEIEKVLKAVKAKSFVEEVDFLEQKRSFELFKSQMATYAPEIFQDDQLLSTLPLSANVNIKSDLSPEDMQKMAQELKAEFKSAAGVEDISLGGELFARYTKLNETLAWFTGSFTVLVLVLAGFAMMNMINELIRTHKDEISILELFGASPWRIRKKFYLQASLISFLGTSGAMVLLGVFFSYGLDRTERILGFMNLHQYLQFFSPLQVVLALAISPVLGLGAAHLSLRRLNSGWLAAAAG